MGNTQQGMSAQGNPNSSAYGGRSGGQGGQDSGGNRAQGGYSTQGHSSGQYGAGGRAVGTHGRSVSHPVGASASSREGNLQGGGRPGAPAQGSSGSSRRASGGASRNDGYQRQTPQLTEEEYDFIARDIMAKPPFAGYLKYHLPVRYAARCEEVRWEWYDSNGRLCRQELIGGGKNSDLEYD